ncbi:MAG TPA: mycofactocin-coupled SDR family oxidoreductase [Solirubrobacteraceae bacterium]|nr:mycofactocin-coupled SDR family oxidoreductase [Solirubrobacteraceae bacterium]
MDRAAGEAEITPRVAIVTGAARGIGAATALKLADDGWTVIAVDLGRDDPRLPYPLGTQKELDDVAARGSAGPGRITSRLVDATDAAAMRALVERTVAEHGGLDAFVAAAGVIAGGAPQWELDADAERAVLDVCLGAVLTASRIAIPALLKRPQPRRGRFLAVSSTAALRGLPMLAAYCAAKAGVAGLIRALAAELRGTGVTANAVCPGSTNTRILEESARLYDLEHHHEFAAQQPLERLIEPDEVAALLAWLAGPDADAMTGAIIPVDGGLSI